jgi:CBS domain-containing protein
MARSEFHDAYDDPLHTRGEIFNTPVSDLPLREPIMIESVATAADAVDAMNEHHTGCVLVASSGQLVGIFTERDVLTKVVFRHDGPLTPLDAVMTPNPETLETDATIAFALNMMSVGGYRHIPIVSRGGKPVGVLSVRDIVDFLVELYPEEVLNLPPTPAKGIADSADGG